jgi:formylmethanofuran dehydrogenase subunit E
VVRSVAKSSVKQPGLVCGGVTLGLETHSIQYDRRNQVNQDYDRILKTIEKREKCFFEGIQRSRYFIAKYEAESKR